jgi:hypothetical protein
MLILRDTQSSHDGRLAPVGRILGQFLVDFGQRGI